LFNLFVIKIAIQVNIKMVAIKRDNPLKEWRKKLFFLIQNLFRYHITEDIPSNEVDEKRQILIIDTIGK